MDVLCCIASTCARQLFCISPFSFSVLTSVCACRFDAVLIELFYVLVSIHRRKTTQRQTSARFRSWKKAAQTRKTEDKSSGVCKRTADGKAGTAHTDKGTDESITNLASVVVLASASPMRMWIQNWCAFVV